MRRLPPLNSLRAFEAAARHLSFVKAAEELGVTQTAVSHQIKQLEDHLGRVLFVRRPRPLRLSATGEQLFPVVRESFDTLARALAEVAVPDPDAPLVVTTTNAFAARWLLPRLAEWQAAYPRIRFDIRSGEALSDLSSGNVDFAVRYSRTPPPGVIALELFSDRFVPMLSPSLHQRIGPIARPSDLLRAPLIAFEWKSKSPDAPDWKTWFTTHLPPGEAQDVIGRCEWLRVSEESQAIELALSGQGIALASDGLVKRDLASGRLVAPLPLSLPGYSFWVAYQPDHPRWSDIETFAEWARAAHERD